MHQIRYSDGATPFLEQVIAEKPKWLESALKSAGYWAKKEIDTGIRSGAPGGNTYRALMPVQKRRELDDLMVDPSHSVLRGRRNKRHPRRNYRILGDLGKAVKYDKRRVSQGVVTVGWASRSAVKLGTWQEKGVLQPVTEKMRRLFFAAGIGLRKGTMFIENPARPTYESMKPILERGAPERVQSRIMEYIDGVIIRSKAKNSRVYRVYS